ncbi:mechanosensitive ion channel [Gammaproteobacteria bacterium]|nr:mechanosensitive ion channel [Gammaproteobacteria bacterium]
MPFDLQIIIDSLATVFQFLKEQITQTGNLLQILVIVVIYIISLLFARQAKPWLESKARKIKDSPELLRIISSTLRRMEWFFFVIQISVIWLILSAANWSGTYLIYLALLFSMVWLLITVVTQSIRNRALRRFIAITGWIYVAISILGINDNVSSILDAADFSVSGFRVSLLLLLKISLMLIVTLWLAISVGNFLERRLLRNEDLSPGLRVLLGKVLRITLIVFALIIAISSIGIDLSVLSLLSGAIGIGIGFGLQKVVSNFISGFIILADRSIKPGDTISLGETFGWINELRARFVSVITRDGVEYLIPNEDFITQQVINWSFSNELVRIEVKFGVAYDSDPHQVAELAVEATKEVERVVSYRPSVCWLTGFGDSSLDFVLRFWIKDPQNGLTNIRGQVLLALWDSFKANDIKIPYPHREVILNNPPASWQKE